LERARAGVVWAGSPESGLGKAPAGTGGDDGAVVPFDDLAGWAAEGFAVALLTGVLDRIAATVCAAVGPAGVGGFVVVELTVVALLSDFHNSVSANGVDPGVEWGGCGRSAHERVSSVERLDGSRAS